MYLLAYIDPGSGLLIWQAVVAVALGVVFYLKRTREMVADFFRRIFHRKP
jgi:hypothetical protein